MRPKLQQSQKALFFQNFIGCPTVQFLNFNAVNHRKGSLLIYFLPQKVLKTSLAFFLFLEFNNKIRAQKSHFWLKFAPKMPKNYFL